VQDNSYAAIGLFHKAWGSPGFVDTDQGFTGLSVGAAMNRCS
jgi:hypothetical protein